MKNPNAKRILTIVLVDLGAFLLFSFGVCAIVFNLFGGNQNLMQEAKTLNTPTPAPSQAPSDTPVPVMDTPAPAENGAGAATAAPTEVPTPSPTPEPTGLLKGKFAEKFSEERISTEDTYRSQDIAIELTIIHGGFCESCRRVSHTADVCEYCGKTLHKTDKQDVYLADIYLQDMEAFRSFAISHSGDVDKVKKLGQAHDAILAVNSDFYVNSKYNGYGWFVRNGEEIAKKKIDSDLGILYLDGTMDTIDYKNDTWSDDEIYSKYPRHIWYFGPALLAADGQSKTSFNLHGPVAAANPRTVIGYYEPGHYMLMVVNGRRGSGDSRGLSLEELSIFCQDLGLAKAYNLDGGDSSAMYFNGQVYGPNGRGTSDIIYIAEPDTQA